MNHFKLFFLGLMFSFIGAFAQHKEISFNHLTVEDGLSQSSVLSITQDSLGFMWFGTKDGLNKFNTQNFEIYKYHKNDKSSLTSSMNINALLTDSKGNVWVGTQKGLNLYLPKTNSFKRFQYHPDKKYSLSNNIIRSIYEDHQGFIWVGTDSGLNKLVAADKFERFMTRPVPDKGQTYHLIKTIFQDHNNVLWVGTLQGLTSMELKNGQYIYKSYVHERNRPESLSDNDISSILEDHKHNLWIGTHSGGLELLDRSTGSFRHFRYKKGQPNTISSNVIRKMLQTKAGKLWVSTINGINIIDLETFAIKVLNHLPDDPSSLNQNSIYDLMQDAAGSIWVGTYYGGVNVYHVNSTPFRGYKSKIGKNGLSSNVVSSIVEDTKHNLWIGTEAEGLNYYDRTSGKFSSFRHDPENPASLSSTLVKAVSIDRNGKVWVGTYEGGLDLYLPETKTFRHYKPNPADPAALNSNRIVALLHDRQGRFWIGTRASGIHLYNEGSDNFSHFYGRHPEHDLKVVRTLFQDSKGNVWMACGSGTYILEPNTTQVKRFKTNDERMLLDDINFIQEDSRGYIWLGGYESGLIRYMPVRKTIRAFTKDDGLPSNVVLGMLEDDKGNLWISTDNGLSKFDREKFKTYTVRDGLPGNVFNYNSFFKDSRGEFFFGGFNGLLSFFPDQIKDNNRVPKVVFTRLKLFNKPVAIGDETELLTENIGLTKALTFSYHQNIFTVDFAILNYIKPEKNRYAYKLEGFEKDWNYVNSPSATFTNLPSGTYTLLIRGSNNDGVWNPEPTRLIIHVNPPFWKTWWAYLIYLSCFLGLLFLFSRFLWIRALLKREHEVYQMKLDFFTNVSHEIRTPLTLIEGPLESLIEETRESPVLNRKLLLVRRNAGRLTRLVNELLDFRKAESGKLGLNIAPGNIVSFAKEIFLSFQDLAIRQQLKYEFLSEEEHIEVYFDNEQLEKVLYNLLSNAFKCTPDQGVIRLSVFKTSDGFVELRVCDNGKSIPEESRDKLFTNFYQVKDPLSRNSGTGIGLALSRKIAQLHHGGLFLSEKKDMHLADMNTCFCLRLMLGRSHFSKEELMVEFLNSENPAHYEPATDMEELVMLVPASEQKVTDEQVTLLIVEDNPEVREFIVQSLKPFYQILEADNGVLGLALAFEKIPDLIVSDVMMPVMDGLELCRTLKTDIRTSHIPVILLTARTGNIHEVNGLKTGAEAYLTKPFSISSLQLTISNLLMLQANMRRKFSQQITLQPSNIVIESSDEEFLNKVMDLIESNFTSLDFNVNTLASDLGMSTPILYKKIKVLTGLTVNNFIKSVRLKRAAQLLCQNVYTVYEIAYNVGFSDPKYFSKEFVKQFGRTPSDYALQE
ncbi:hybrid sensor histidine kinase/response regulator transcription factor [Pedobacter cryoconitis]|uniref:histidine kinase n=1 Tax=Pedobacter cryoconitis TaxID=188932 RepID=A0A7X0J4Z3_9SPHI|nr:hybrid sensor histidine kinase/response regulator transcription factor [Pedobacter cryoconitis]MBB6501239.1 ligand-binding sensor domain-containing protein/signal transduction histidine kinase/DNA-binding response OmpR family regulator [Pedobacter cryoconitis]